MFKSTGFAFSAAACMPAETPYFPQTIAAYPQLRAWAPTLLPPALKLHCFVLAWHGMAEHGSSTERRECQPCALYACPFWQLHACDSKLISVPIDRTEEA